MKYMSKEIHMRQLLELLRLHCEFNYSQRVISQSINVSKTTVGKYIELFNNSGLSWPLPEEYLDPDKLFARLNKKPIPGNNGGGGGSGDDDDGGYLNSLI